MCACVSGRERFVCVCALAHPNHVHESTSTFSSALKISQHLFSLVFDLRLSYIENSHEILVHFVFFFIGGFPKPISSHFLRRFLFEDFVMILVAASFQIIENGTFKQNNCCHLLK